MLALATQSPPRRVGDGGEYIVMARQLAAGRAPAVTPAEMAEARQALAALDGFESSLLDYPQLVGRDGRQDFLHFFLYPALSAPSLLLVTHTALHPNWAFTFVNTVLLATAVFLTLRQAAWPAVVAGFAGPIIWWVDKAHTEALLFAAVAVAALLFRHQPALAMLAWAVAGAQNAALGVAYPVFALLLWLATRRTTWTIRAGMALAAGGALVAAPFAYNWVRLGRWSPMAEYAEPAVPSVAGLLAFVFEPNIGLLPHAPVYALALAAALWLAVRRLRSLTPPLSWWWWPAVISALLLLVWAQNPNANHGGTPGINRWVLSLLALGLPWIAETYATLAGARRAVFAAAVVGASLAGTFGHLPQHAENDHEPTRAARWLWERGWIHLTPAEVFAERVAQREPALVPTHDGECRILLIANQESPATCAPPTATLPPACRVADALCYAIIASDGAHYVVAPSNGFFHLVATPSWPAGGPLAAGLRRVLDDADPAARVWRLEDTGPWRARLPGAEIGAVIATDRARVVYVARANRDALRAARAVPSGRLVTLIPLAEVDAGIETTTNIVLVMPSAEPGASGGRP